MKVKEVVEIINDPVIIYNNYNMGTLSSFTASLLKATLESKIDWIEGIGNKNQVAIYISSNK